MPVGFVPAGFFMPLRWTCCRQDILCATQHGSGWSSIGRQPLRPAGFLATSPLARVCPFSGGRKEMARLGGYGLTEEERAQTLEGAPLYVVPEVEIAA